MNKELLSKMAQDMMLFQFEDESEINFCTRVLYSGIAMWMKAITLDNFENNFESSHSVSKKHHYERSEYIFNQLLDFFPGTRNWFYYKYEQGESTDSPIHIMRERMLIIGEIIEQGFSGYLSMPSSKRIRIQGKVLRYFGLHSNILVQYNGMVTLTENIMGSSVNDSSILDCLEFSNNYFSHLQFLQDDRNVAKEYFDPTIKTHTFYQSWTDRAPNCEIYLYRINSGNGRYRYFVEKNKDKQILSHKIEDFLIESGNYLRLLLSLRYKLSNPLQVTIVRHKEYFELKRNVRTFPFPEESFIQGFGWPKNNLYDNLNWIYHNHLYEEIKRILRNLLITVNEVNYE